MSSTKVADLPPPQAPTPGQRARRLGVLLLLTLALACLLAWGLERGRPVNLPDVGGARLPCVSYAPFRRAGQTPFDPTLRVPPDQIEADLRLLATLTPCVRTYGVDHGLDAVPGIARRLGLHVVLGAWIGRNPLANADQLDRALALARSHADVVDLLVVGNEVLLRRELAPAALATLLAQAKRESAVPVAYADVWELWLRHGPVLRGHVDVVAAHILPYWEDSPVAVADAVDHVAGIAAALGAVFAPLPVYIAETGWPAAGRQRGPAVPGPLEQARFVRELLARQATEPLPFNLIEGFDQPWKRALEGAMGGAWGLFDAQGQVRVPLRGPVVPDPHGWRSLAAAALGALAGLVWAVWRGRAWGQARTSDRPWPALALMLGGAGCAALVPLQWAALVLWGRGPLAWGLGALTILLALLCALAAASRLADRMRLPGPAVRPGLVDAWGQGAAAGPRLLALAQAGFLFLVAMDAVGLVFDPRYRPLGWPTLAAPALLLLALPMLGDRLGAGAREERLLAAVCAGCAPLIALQEGLANTEALLYVALLLALAAAILVPHGAEPVEGRTRARPASSTAGAARVVE
jgi:glucan 1,3-beta-glucosidase